jgi:two-component system cell cycle response regulator DivK
VAKRILVVEDDLLNRVFLNDTLESGGFTVRIVTDGAQVLTVAGEFTPDLITMDINLPNVSGVEVIETLRADPRFSAIPIIAITAYVGKGEQDRIREAGASVYMAKPISIKPFLETVERLLG